jgi:hypothetical protein
MVHHGCFGDPYLTSSERHVGPEVPPDAFWAQIWVSAGKQRPHGCNSRSDSKSETDLRDQGLNIARNGDDCSRECQHATSLRVDGIDRRPQHPTFSLDNAARVFEGCRVDDGSRRRRSHSISVPSERNPCADTASDACREHPRMSSTHACFSTTEPATSRASE